MEYAFMDKKVVLLMGSQRDMDFSQKITKYLRILGLDYEYRIASAHKTPEKVLEDQKHYEMTYGGNIDDGAVLLGQSIGAIKTIESVKDIMDNMVKTAEKALINASKMVV